MTEPTNLAVDDNLVDQGDTDSSYSSDIESYTTSLKSKATDFRFHHGRRYHASEDSNYHFPNDEKESDRMDLAHQMMVCGLDGKLFTAPLEDPKRILDVGTGTGIWAMEMGEKFPDSDVLGNDLSPIQPRWVPPNVHFEVDDVEKEWTYSQKFDFIHVRALNGALKDWPALVKRVFDFLEPGGYCEFYELDIEIESVDGSLAPDSPLKKIDNMYMAASRDNGTDPTPGRSIEKWVKEAGFQDVVATKIPLPLGTWPKDKHMKEVGAWNYLQANEGLEGFISFLFTTRLGWSSEEVNAFSAKVRKQLKDRTQHTYYDVYDVVGRKPEA